MSNVGTWQAQSNVEPVSTATIGGIANIANYGVLGGFMVLEYIVRRRVFATLPYRNFAEFARRMAGLGPAFWRDVLR